MCCAVAVIPPLEWVTLDTPLRLGVAALLAFPDGSMTAPGLRREAARGRLVIERIAGKDYTTLAIAATIGDEASSAPGTVIVGNRRFLLARRSRADSWPTSVPLPVDACAPTGNSRK